MKLNIIYLLSCLVFMQSERLVTSFTPPAPGPYRTKPTSGLIKQPLTSPPIVTSPSSVTPPSVFVKPQTLVAVSAAALTSLVALPNSAEATSSLLVTNAAIPPALCSFAHTFSVLGIVICLVAERFLVSTDMSDEDEDTIVTIDVLYGVLAMLLIGSGFARAAVFEKGGDFYIHESLFWLKMVVSGFWGGLSLFPSLIFYKRKDARADLLKNTVEGQASTRLPISDVLVGQLHRIITAEIAVLLTIPLLASLMSRGVGYSSDFPWQAGAFASLAATGGSFFYYGRQALTWDDTIKETKDADTGLGRRLQN